jgi:hypothetical protein
MGITHTSCNTCEPCGTGEDTIPGMGLALSVPVTGKKETKPQLESG